MKAVKKFLKYILYLFAITLTLVVLIIIFINPIAKWAIQKYDTKFIGREITLNAINIGVLNGSLDIVGLTVYEKNSDKRFLTFGELKTKISIWQTIKSKYIIEYFELSNYSVSILQNGSKFNFDDLLELGSDTTTTKKPEVENPEPTLWFLNKLNLYNGTILYNDKQVGIKTTLNNLNVLLPVFNYNSDKLFIETDFLVNKQGKIKADLNLILSNLKYKLNCSINQLSIKPFYPYLKEMLLAKDFKGYLSSNLKLAGSFSNPSDIALKGHIGLNNFLLTDVLNEKLTAIDQLKITIDSINVPKSIFNINAIELNGAYVKTELYENGTNFNRLLKTDTNQISSTNSSSNSDTLKVQQTQTSSSNLFILIADYVKMVAKDYILNTYSADKVSLNNIEVDYSDFTLGEQFYVNLENMSINSNRISSENERITATFSTNINQKGNLLVDISANPKDFLEMDFKTDLKSLPLTMFNPYVKYYLAHTFKTGDLNLLIQTSINANHQLKAENNLLIEKIKCNKRIKGIKTAAKVPLKLGVAMLRDPKGNIDFKFPVNGNLNDPKYKIGKIVLKIFENLLVKAATAPFNAVGSLLGKKEPATEFEFDYLQTDFNNKEQRKVLEKTAETLIQKPELIIQFTQNVNVEKETELLVYRLAKEIYINNPTYVSPKKEDEIKNIDKFDNKDSLFTYFVSSQFKDLNTKISHLDKCKRLVGEDKINKKLEELFTTREAEIKRILIENKVNEKQILLNRNTDKKTNLNQVKPSVTFDIDSKD